METTHHGNHSQLSTAQRLDRLTERIQEADFLANKGLGNEVGLHVFAYDPADELLVREHVARLRRKEDLACNIVERNLWDVLLQICKDKKIIDKIAGLEERRGSDALLGRLQRIATPESFVEAMDYTPHQLGDVLLITGVGQVYPFMRAHSVLENCQHVFADIPVVLFYPGSYDGQRLSFFKTVDDYNYYRAFNIVS